MENRMDYDNANPPAKGVRVDVWNRSLGHWSGQFEVASSSPRGVKVRRQSDAELLPEEFAPDEVRPSRPPSAW